jgi:hypothetical protein
MPPDDPLQRSSSADLPEPAPQNEPRQPNFDLTSGQKTVEDGLPSPSPANSTASEGHPPKSLGRIRDYELLEKLGEGGMGTVYKAMHVNLERQVAVKILPRDKLVDPQAVARFKREMKAVGQLVHPNIVLAHDAGEADGQHYLVMELVEGLDLTQLVARLGPLPVADACELVRQAALGLEHAHHFGLVHRDIKPSNLILTSAGQTKILDLGLALLNSAQPASGLTGDCQVMGTADFMAPEQAADSHAVDIRADIYSLGCTLYKLLTGEPPFAGSQYRTPLNKLMAHAQTAPVPIYQVRGGVPAELSNIIGRMLAKSPAERHATPQDIAVALKPFCKGSDLAALYARAAGRPVPVPAAPESETASSAASALQQTNNAIESAPKPEVPPPLIPSPGSATTGKAQTGKTNWRRAIAATAVTLVLASVVFLATKPYRPTGDPTEHSGGIVDNAPSPLGESPPNEKSDEELETTDASLEQPAKAQLVWPTRHVDREVAERVIEAGGLVGVEPGGNFREVSALPTRPFHIRYLDIDGCQSLTDEDFELIGKLRYVKSISAMGSCVNNDHLHKLEQLRLLESLSLNNTRITDDGLRALAGLDRLSTLILFGTPVGDDGLATVGRLRDLEQLDMSATAVTDGGLSQLAPLVWLRTLGLKTPGITDSALQHVSKLNAVRDLDLQGTRITGQRLRDLASLAHLRYLNLAETPLTDAAMENVPALLQLRHLVLDWTPLSDGSVNVLSQLRDIAVIEIQKGVTGDPPDCVGGGENLGKSKAAFLP